MNIKADCEYFLLHWTTLPSEQHVEKWRERSRSAKPVAQIGNLLFRRMAFGRAQSLTMAPGTTLRLRISNPRHCRVSLAATGAMPRWALPLLLDEKTLHPPAAVLKQNQRRKDRKAMDDDSANAENRSVPTADCGLPTQNPNQTFFAVFCDQFFLRPPHSTPTFFSNFGGFWRLLEEFGVDFFILEVTHSSLDPRPLSLMRSFGRTIHLLESARLRLI